MVPGHQNYMNNHIMVYIIFLEQPPEDAEYIGVGHKIV